MPRGLCCLPIKIKSRYYPLVFIGLITIMFGISWSLLTGMALGYLYVFGYAERLKTSDETLRAWEAKWPFEKYKDSPSFRKGPHSGR